MKLFPSTRPVITLESDVQFYSIIDSSDGFYTNNVHPEYRSRTSVPFRVLGGDVALEQAFCREAEAAGLHQLSGHHTVGGCLLYTSPSPRD